jgi:hypothetical protein
MHSQTAGQSVSTILSGCTRRPAFRNFIITGVAAPLEVYFKMPSTIAVVLGIIAYL